MTPAPVPKKKLQANALLLPAYLNLVACYLKLNDTTPSKVLETANKAVALAPASAKALYRRAQAYVRHRIGKALEMSRQL